MQRKIIKAALNATRTSHALNKYNYQRLLEKIDSNQDGHYSEQECVEAVHAVSHRDRLYRAIAKHASEWYYGKDDPLWKKYLDRLTTDAPLWKKYLETFIEKMQWMKAVPGLGWGRGICIRWCFWASFILRKEYYRSLTTTDGESNAQVRFFNGWISRVNDFLRVEV
jgi:hypothetical protein